MTGSQGLRLSVLGELGATLDGLPLLLGGSTSGPRRAGRPGAGGRPAKGGGLELLGAEYMVVDEDQRLDTDADQPFLMGQPFDGPMRGHEPGMPVHYDLHVWTHKANPAGVFSPWNPKVSC